MNQNQYKDVTIREKVIKTTIGYYNYKIVMYYLLKLITYNKHIVKVFFKLKQKSLVLGNLLM